MRALATLTIALLLPIWVLNMIGGLLAGIWLAFLGEWKSIGMGLILYVTSHHLLAWVLMPAVILFSAPAVKMIESGRTTLGRLSWSLAVLYRTSVIVVWAYLILRYFYDRASNSSEIPLLLWSYGAATGPWAYIASKDCQAQEGDNRHSVFHVLFLSVGYICSMLALLFRGVSLSSCLWILGSFMAVSCIASAFVSFTETKAKASQTQTQGT
jgi:hypothetical protein